MRVIVTRPETAARRTAARLEALGHEPVLLSLTAAIHHPNRAAQALRQPYAGIAVTSAEAIRALAASEDFGQIDLKKPFYAVGDATASAAGMAGFLDIRCGSGTGAGLAAMIAADRPQGALVYLAGMPRSPDFENGLRSHKVPFLTTEIYSMRPINHPQDKIDQALLDPPADGVLLYSPENARLFFQLTRNHEHVLAETRLFCLSRNVAAAVPPAFQRNISIAKTIDEHGLLALLGEWKR